ncbi:hypothetical protein ABMA28_014071 [Loxostege sticticalis]|uniref:THAP-type domain-containing protein n=1 Tax=Loxostege sticticalis TaxID=481309 RepID=A0ABD0TFL0_LOXSC
MTTSGSRVYCSVYGCLNSTLIKPELSFLGRSEWLRLMSRQDLLHKQHRGYSVCEDHFAKHDILPGTRRKNLKKKALPTLNYLVCGIKIRKRKP